MPKTGQATAVPRNAVVRMVTVQLLTACSARRCRLLAVLRKTTH